MSHTSCAPQGAASDRSSGPSTRHVHVVDAPGQWKRCIRYDSLGSWKRQSRPAITLFARLTQEIEEHKPKNCIHFVVDFLCKHYPEHLHGFASIWQMDPDLEGERHEVVNFFKAHKISTAVAAHFANAGYDTLDTLTTLSPEGLVDIEAFNNVKWLPGHKVRLQQIFQEISARVRAFREQQQLHRPKGAPPTAAAAQRSAMTACPYNALSSSMTTAPYYPSALLSNGMQQLPPQLALPQHVRHW